MSGLRNQAPLNQTSFLKRAPSDLSWDEEIHIEDDDSSQLPWRMGTVERAYTQQVDHTVVRKELHFRPMSSKSAFRGKSVFYLSQSAQPRTPCTSPEPWAIASFNNGIPAPEIPPALGHYKQQLKLRKTQKAQIQEYKKQQHEKKVLKTRTAITRLSQSALGLTKPQSLYAITGDQSEVSTTSVPPALDLSQSTSHIIAPPPTRRFSTATATASRSPSPFQSRHASVSAPERYVLIMVGDWN